MLLYIDAEAVVREKKDDDYDDDPFPFWNNQHSNISSSLIVVLTANAGCLPLLASLDHDSRRSHVSVTLLRI